MTGSAANGEAILRWAKRAIVLMTLMLVAGTILLVYGVVTETSRQGWDSKASKPRIESEDFGTLDLGQPPGTSIAAIIRAKGALVLHLRDGGLDDRLVVLDPMTGTLRGTVVMGAGAPVSAAPQDHAEPAATSP